MVKLAVCVEGPFHTISQRALHLKLALRYYSDLSDVHQLAPSYRKIK